MNRLRDILVTVMFVGQLAVVFIGNKILKDSTISVSERRKLAQFPKITMEKILNGKVSKEFDDYTVDQFIKRDFFRGIKNLWSTKIYVQKDDNKMFVRDDSIFKMEYPLVENNVRKNAEKIQKIYDKHLKEMNVYYAIIPDKNFYLEDDDHLKMDYEKLKDIMSNQLEELTYIDIWEELELDDYYRTDLHWKQEEILQVSDKIQTDMKIVKNINFEGYEIKDVGNFYGTYYGQTTAKVTPDDMFILSNSTIENASTYNYETKTTGKVYDEKETNDKYDIYISGATPLIRIDNPNSNNEKELLLFRDSFGSSIAPLLIENYKTITLIDLRYISSELLDEFIEFKNQDVLFLYSTLILNQNVLK